MSNQFRIDSSKQMFKDAILYLLNSYLDEGYSSNDAKALVARDIQEIHSQYASSGVLQPVKTNGIFNPARTVETLLEEVKALKTTRVHKDEQAQFKYRMDSLTRNLTHLKNVMK